MAILARQLPLAVLIEFCRAVRHNLAAGLPIVRVFRQQGERGPIAVRAIAARISSEIDKGESLQAALEAERSYFPPIFLSLAAVGEQSGALPEVLGELEKYFLLLQRLRREFYQRIAWPAIQFILAPFVIAGMIYILAILRAPFDPLGLGFVGEMGALKFLLYFFGLTGLVIGGGIALKRSLRYRQRVDEWLLLIPAIGPCLRAIAMVRFCVALRLTLETGMSLAKAIRLSLQATGNRAFDARDAAIVSSLKQGDDLAGALGEARIFPADFLDIIANAEESGRTVEVLAHQIEFYEDEARRRLTILTRAASWGFYAGVAGLLIFMILRMAFGIYGSGGVLDKLSAP